MTIRYHCDSCDCIIDFNSNVNWVNSFKNCRHHIRSGQAHLDEVLAQNKRFNSAFGNIELSDNQKEIIITAKELNKLRIRVEPRIGFDEHLPFEIPVEPVLSWIARLRARLRL